MAVRLAGWRERDTQVPSFLADSGTRTSHKAERGVSDQESRVLPFHHAQSHAFPTPDSIAFNTHVV